jgi:hypothetical protein
MPDDSLTPAQLDAATTLEELFTALVGVAFARARLTRQPIDAAWTLTQIHSLLFAIWLEKEDIPRDKAFRWRGDGLPTRENIVVFSPPKFSVTAPSSLDGALYARAQTITRQRPRERRERRSARTVGSRGDPSPDESDDEDHLAPSPDEGAA